MVASVAAFERKDEKAVDEGEKAIDWLAPKSKLEFCVGVHIGSSTGALVEVNVSAVLCLNTTGGSTERPANQVVMKSSLRQSSVL